MRRASGASTYYQFHLLGGTVSRLNSSATVVSSHTQDAFGQPASTGSANDPYAGRGAQAGYYRDFESGLYYCTYRYYDPVNCRFSNRDPIGYQGGMNQYRYVNGNPIGRLDPTGLDYTLVIASDNYHSWIQVFDDTGKLVETYGLWQFENQRLGKELDRKPIAQRALHVKGDTLESIKKPNKVEWKYWYNCSDYAEDIWEMNGGSIVYEGSMIRTPWGMVGEINRENKKNPSSVKVPKVSYSEDLQSTSSSSSSNSSSSLSSNRGSYSSGSSFSFPRRKLKNNGSKKYQ